MRVPHGRAGERPWCAHADPEIAAHLAHHVAEQREQHKNPGDEESPPQGILAHAIPDEQDFEKGKEPDQESHVVAKRLRERFDLEVPEEDLEGVTTVGQAVDLVLAKVGS